jgi:hypothetical protein
MIDTSGQEAAVATVCVESAEKFGLIAAKMPSTSTDNDADSQMMQQLDLSSPTRGRDRRVEKTKELLLKLEQQKKKWQQLQNRNSLRQDVLPNLKQRLSGKKAATTPPTSPKSVAVLMKRFKSAESPMGVEDMASVNSGTKDNSESGVVVNSWENLDQIFDPLVDVCSKSTDSAELTGTFHSKVSGSIIKGAIETQPIGGAKYYVMVNTKKGQAKIVHEAMPATGREGFKFAMEEKGYEIMEYDFLTEKENKPSKAGREKEPSKVITPSNSTLMGEEASIAESTGRSRSEVSGSLMKIDKVMNKVKETQPIGGPKNDITQHVTKKTEASGTGEDKSFQTWLDEGFNFALDVAEKIDDDLTKLTKAVDKIHDAITDAAPCRANDDTSDSDEESFQKHRRQKIRERSKKGRRPRHQHSHDWHTESQE